MSVENFTGPDFTDPVAGYRELALQLTGLLTHEHDIIANAANTAALIFNALPDLNWAGFYFHRDGELVLGPFQGKPACVRIAIGRGVCGTAAERRTTVLVPDVHAFPGHIACDTASRSEVVIPLVLQEPRFLQDVQKAPQATFCRGQTMAGGSLLGVLDLDSPLPGRFGEADRDGLERLAAIFLDSLRS